MDVAFKSGFYKDQTLVFDICLPQNLLISAHGHVMVHWKLKTAVKNDDTIFFNTILTDLNNKTQYFKPDDKVCKYFQKCKIACLWHLHPLV